MQIILYHCWSFLIINSILIFSYIFSALFQIIYIHSFLHLIDVPDRFHPAETMEMHLNEKKSFNTIWKNIRLYYFTPSEFFTQVGGGSLVPWATACLLRSPGLFLCNLVDLNNVVVWMVSNFLLISNASSSLLSPTNYNKYSRHHVSQLFHFYGKDPGICQCFLLLFLLYVPLKQ